MRQSQTASLANQMKHRDREMVPKVLVQAMFALMLASLALVAFATLTDRPHVGTRPPVDVVDERVLTMRGDRSEGVGLYDADGTRVAHSSEKRKGFIDVIWVSVARARMQRGLADDAPIRVVRDTDGHVSVFDDASGFSIKLVGYGVDNVAAFADLLPDA